MPAQIKNGIVRLALWVWFLYWIYPDVKQGLEKSKKRNSFPFFSRCSQTPRPPKATGNREFVFVGS